MSVQTEIDRLRAAKAELKTAIEEKGVTVPDTATLDGYGALVAEIRAGGGSDWQSIPTNELPRQPVLPSGASTYAPPSAVYGYLTVELPADQNALELYMIWGGLWHFGILLPEESGVLTDGENVFSLYAREGQTAIIQINIADTYYLYYRGTTMPS